MSGGEVAACLVVEAVTRLLDGAMGNAESPVTESFGAAGLLEEPHFHASGRLPRLAGARSPAVGRPWPDRQVAGLAQALHRTRRERPDLIDRRGGLSDAEQALLERPPSAYP